MKKIYKFISIMLITVILVSNCCFSYKVVAITPFDITKDAFKSIIDNVKTDANNTIQDFTEAVRVMWRAVGYVVNPGTFGHDIGRIINYIKSHSLYGCDSNSTDQEVINNYLRSMKNSVNISGENITISDSFNSGNKTLINDWTSQAPYIYAYSKNISTALTYFSSSDEYLAVKTWLENNQNNLIFGYKVNSSQGFVMTIKDNGLIYYSNVADSHVSCEGYNKQFTDTTFDIYKYNSNTKQLYKDGTQQYIQLVLSKYEDNNAYNANTFGYNNVVFTSGKCHVYKVYRTLADYQSDAVGESSYYVNTQTYNTWNNSTGDYTIDNSNCNNVTYGDITNYITNYYNDNNVYPTPEDIQIVINQQIIVPTPTPTPIPDNPSGDSTVSGNTNNGGSASASATANNSGVNVTVNNNHNINFNVPGLSGNGIGSGTVSSNGNGSGGIFDWISDIGGVIGDFIKNVGQLIADVIKGITETITTVLADIPNIISVLVEFVYGGLPDELKAIVTLGITTVIFVGVIKMMRK